MAQGTRTKRFIEALSRIERDRAVDDMAALFADDAEVKNPMHHPAYRGPNGAREFWEHYRHAFGAIESSFRNTVESENVAILEWTSRGTAPNGQPFEYGGVSVIEYDRDKITRFCAYFDPAQLGAQMHPAAGP